MKIFKAAMASIITLILVVLGVFFFFTNDKWKDLPPSLYDPSVFKISLYDADKFCTIDGRENDILIHIPNKPGMHQWFLIEGISYYNINSLAIPKFSGKDPSNIGGLDCAEIK